MALKVAAQHPDIANLLDLRSSLEPISSGHIFTEGPLWDQREEALYFQDIKTDSRYRWSAATGARLVASPCFKANGLVLDAQGDLLICENATSMVVRQGADSRREIVAAHYQGTYLNSPNDVVTRSDGTVFFTDPDYGRWDDPCGVPRPFELGFTGLFRVARSGEVELAAPKSLFEQPNGLAFSPDESRLYVDDVHGIRVFDVDARGVLSNMGVFKWGMGSPPSNYQGDPDGMKCDELGNVWCAARGGVWIVNPAGELLGVLETPNIVANLTWGDPDLKTLFLCCSGDVYSLRTRVAAAVLPYHRVTHGAG
ncbi:MAG: SMP-30/gluconolactonase/LRE family protein [Propionibacteriaceae bacterium]|jgi:gluconolactonase|nr:SMP-30/gluconolactonase/LRE family protein [Propionibacteriaceae bacterium]